MSENTNLVEMLREEMRGGFAMVAGEIRQTNHKLDILTDRVDTLTDRVDTLTDRVDTLSDRVDTMDKNLSTKLNGISSLFLESENRKYDGQKFDY